MNSLYYTVGARSALSQVGLLEKVAMPSMGAGRAVLEDLARPAVAGAALGGLAGGAAAAEGHRGEGALLGASMGGAGAALGGLAGKGVTAMRMRGPEAAFASGLKNSIPAAEQAAAHAVSPEFARMALNDKARGFAASAEGQKLWGAVQQAGAEGPMHERGGAMLGGTLGALGGIAKTPQGDQRPSMRDMPQPVSQFEDPYRYSLEGFPGQ